MFWQTLDSAPKDGTRFLAIVNGEVRIVGWGKTSHLPRVGFNLLGQGWENCEMCEPSYWHPFPHLPFEEKPMNCRICGMHENIHVGKAKACFAKLGTVFVPEDKPNIPPEVVVTCEDLGVDEKAWPKADLVSAQLLESYGPDWQEKLEKADKAVAESVRAAEAKEVQWTPELGERILTTGFTVTKLFKVTAMVRFNGCDQQCEIPLSVIRELKGKP